MGLVFRTGRSFAISAFPPVIFETRSRTRSRTGLGRVSDGLRTTGRQPSVIISHQSPSTASCFRLYNDSMDNSILAVLLLLICLALLVAEIFIPSGGLIFAVSMLCLAGSIWFAWNAWGESHPTLWWTFLSALVILLPVSVGGALYLFPRTAMGRRFLLEAPELSEVTPYSEEESHLNQLIGVSGKTLTLLNPGGLVSVDGERLHCESEGMMLDAGTDVRVISVRANRLVVRAISKDESVADGSHDESEDPPLDFALPRS